MQAVCVVSWCQFNPSYGFLSLASFVDPWIHSLEQLLSHMTSHCFLIRSFPAQLLTKPPKGASTSIVFHSSFDGMNEVLSLMEASSEHVCASQGCQWHHDDDGKTHCVTLNCCSSQLLYFCQQMVWYVTSVEPWIQPYCCKCSTAVSSASSVEEYASHTYVHSSHLIVALAQTVLLFPLIPQSETWFVCSLKQTERKVIRSVVHMCTLVFTWELATWLLCNTLYWGGPYLYSRYETHHPQSMMSFTHVRTYVCAFTCATFAFTRQSPCSVNVLFTFSVSDLDMKEGPVCCVPVVCMYTCMCSTFTDPLWTLTDNLSLPFWSCLPGANSWLWSEYMMTYHFPHSQVPVNGCCVGVRACVALSLPQLWIL